jgi:hypothetical protein
LDGEARLGLALFRMASALAFDRDSARVLAHFGGETKPLRRTEAAYGAHLRVLGLMAGIKRHSGADHRPEPASALETPVHCKLGLALAGQGRLAEAWPYALSAYQKGRRMHSETWDPSFWRECVTNLADAYDVVGGGKEAARLRAELERFGEPDAGVTPSGSRRD